MKYSIIFLAVGLEAFLHPSATSAVGGRHPWMTALGSLAALSPRYAWRGRLECGWEGHNMGVTIYSFNLNISPKMSNGVLECDTVVLQNHMLMIFCNKRFCNKKGVSFACLLYTSPSPRDLH